MAGSGEKIAKTGRRQKKSAQGTSKPLQSDIFCHSEGAKRPKNLINTRSFALYENSLGMTNPASLVAASFSLRRLKPAATREIPDHFHLSL
jgi:hypothetical protein